MRKGMKGITAMVLFAVVISAVLVSLSLVFAVSDDEMTYNETTKTAKIKIKGTAEAELQLLTYDNTSSITDAWFEYRYLTHKKFKPKDRHDRNFTWISRASIGKNATTITFELVEKVNRTFPATSCNPFNITAGNGSVTGRNENCTTTNYISEVTERTSFDPYTSTFEKDTNYTFRVNCHVPPELGRRASDCLPIISGFEVTPFAWFDTNWGQGINFTIEEISGLARTEEPITVTFNLSGYNFLASGIDLRIVNQSCRNDGNQIDHDIYKIGGSNFTLRFLANATANANNTFCLYLNNSAASNLTKVSELVFNQTASDTNLWVMENKYQNFTTKIVMSAYKIKVGAEQSANLVGPNDFNRLYANATAVTDAPTCTIVANGSLYVELNCTQAGGRSRLFTLWSRQRWFQMHLGAPTRDEAYSWNFRYTDLNQNVFAYNTTRNTGGGLTGNVSVRGIVGAWQAAGNNLTGILWNTSQFIKNQTEFETFAAGNADALLICAGVGCNVGAPYRSNGSFLYETDFRFINGIGFTTNASRIGYLETEWDKFMNPLEKRTTLGSGENQTAPPPNVVPRTFGLTISPNPAYINNTGNLNVSFLYNDSEGTAGTINATIYRNGVNVFNYTRGNVANDTNVTFLITATGVHSSNWSVRVVVNDSTTEQSIPYNTTNLTISDTPATFRFLSQSPPESVRLNDSANYTAFLDDIDLDNADVYCRVYINAINVQNITFGTNRANATNVTCQTTVSKVHFDNISYQFNATSVFVPEGSGKLSATANTTNITIADTTSIVRTISLNLSTAYVNDSLNASCLYTDIDLDSGACTIQWFVNAVNTANFTRTGLTNGTNMTNIYSGSAFVAFDNVSYKANATSNNLQSATVSSDNLTISDTPPIVRTVSFNSTTVYTTVEPNASAVYEDIDAHAGALTIQWFRNGINTANFTTTGIANGTNVTSEYSGTTLTVWDNVSVRVNATSNNLASAAVSTSNITINPSFIFRQTFQNRVFVDNNINLTFNLTITNTSGITLSTVLMQFNNTNFTMTRVNDSMFYVSINISQRNLSDSNLTVRFFANNTAENETNSTILPSVVFDSTVPNAQLTRVTTGDGFIIPVSLNLTANSTERWPDTLNISIYRGDNTFNFSFSYAANTSIEINFTAANPVGNYTVNLTVNDSTSHNTTAIFTVAIGKINISTTARLSPVNYTTVDTSLGETAALGNNTFWNITFDIPVTLTTDGFLDARTNATTAVNLSLILGNWTTSSIVVTNSTGQGVGYTNTTDVVNFTSEAMSTGGTANMTIRLNAINTLNYSIHRASSGYYYYLVSNNTNSFSEYITVLLPSSEAFDTSATHPRYFVCTDITRTSPPTCNSFTPAVDVLSTNNENNGVNGYTVNMKVKTTGRNITNITYRANHTDSLLQIVMVTGSFVSGAGPAAPLGGGGPPGVVFLPGNITINVTAEEACGYIDADKGICCPAGYTIYNNATSLCERPPSPLAGLELSILQRELFLGLNVFHGLIILGTVAVLTKQRKKLGFLRRR